MSQNKRIIINTVILYLKMIIITVISIFSTRLLLNGLGVEDYGIYNLVVGLVGMLSFLNIAMTTSTLRYNALSLGRNDLREQKVIFNNSLLLHVLAGFIILLFLYFIGRGFILDYLEIPFNRRDVALKVFYLVIINVFMCIISVPFDSLINAHEDILIYSIITIFESLLKLVFVLIVMNSTSDKLLIYTFLITLVPLMSLILKFVYCRLKYKEVSINYSYIDRGQLKEMSSFIGWNFFGAFSNVAKNQGVSIILNLFFGVIINVAYGICNQINGVMLTFSSSLQKAINPVIMKTEGSGDRKSLITLSLTQCRISTFLLSLVSIPLIMNMQVVLKLWLKDIPEYTVLFCQLILVISILGQLTTGIQVAIQSVGKIKYYQLAMSSLLFLNFPISYFFLKYGFSPICVFFVAILIEVVAIVVRICFARVIVGISVLNYFQKVLIPCSSLLLGLFLCFICSHLFLVNNHLFAFLLIVFESLIMVLLIYIFGFDIIEKKYIKQLIIQF